MTDLINRLQLLAKTYPTPGVEATVRDTIAELERLRAIINQPVPLSDWQKMEADLAAARAESDLAHWLLRNARKYMNPMHEALCAAIDNVLQKKQAALAGKDVK